MGFKVGWVYGVGLDRVRRGFRVGWCEIRVYGSGMDGKGCDEGLQVSSGEHCLLSAMHVTTQLRLTSIIKEFVQLNSLPAKIPDYHRTPEVNYVGRFENSDLPCRIILQG